MSDVNSKLVKGNNNGMRFHETRLAGVRLIELDVRTDARGWFCRKFDIEAFSEHGLVTNYPHHNMSFNISAGTLRGMHYQLPPKAEVKLIQCLAGSIYDVLVDLRPDSPTYRQWQAFTLDRPDLLLYAPVGFAHGYQVLQDSSLLYYLMGDTYAPELQRNIRWNDPAIGIDWPMPPTLSEMDASHPDVDWTSAWPAS